MEVVSGDIYLVEYAVHNWFIAQLKDIQGSEVNSIWEIQVDEIDWSPKEDKYAKPAYFWRPNVKALTNLSELAREHKLEPWQCVALSEIVRM